MKTLLVTLLALPALLSPVLAFASDIDVLTVRHPSLPRPTTANGDSFVMDITADGRFTLFLSSAENLVLGSGNLPLQRVWPRPMSLYLRDNWSNATWLVSARADGRAVANGDPVPGGMSENGRFVAFEISTPDTLEGDTNLMRDVFVRDTVMGQTILVSGGLNGGWGNGHSYSPVITPNGRYVAFVSAASNLVPGDTNGIPDVFVRDMESGTTVLVSVNARNAGGSVSGAPRITPDGRYVAFVSSASNLVAGVATTTFGQVQSDVYVRDLVQGRTIWASQGVRDLRHLFVTPFSTIPFVSSFNPQISSDGQFVAYQAVSGNAYASTGGILRFNTAAGVTDLVHTNSLVAVLPRDEISDLLMTPDGSRIAFVIQTNRNFGPEHQAVVWDGPTKDIMVASLNVDGEPAESASVEVLSLDMSGRYLLFTSDSEDLVTNGVSYASHLFLRDLQRNETLLVDRAENGLSLEEGVLGGVLSANGKVVAFETFEPLGTSDVNSSYDVVVQNLDGGTNSVASLAHPELWSVTAEQYSSMARGAAAGDLLVFTSHAIDLLAPPAVGGEYGSVYLARLNNGALEQLAVSTNGASLQDISTEPQISANGSAAVFTSRSFEVVAHDTNNFPDVFWKDLKTGELKVVSLSTNGYVANGSSGGPEISASGRFVLFRTYARNVGRAPIGLAIQGENLALRDMQQGKTWLLTGRGGVSSYNFSADERYVAFVAPAGFSISPSLSVWDTQAEKVIYTNSAAGMRFGSISPDGKRVAFWAGSGVSLLGVHNLEDKTDAMIFSTPAVPGIDDVPLFSPDSTLMAFAISNQIYLHIFALRTNVLVTRSSFGAPGNGRSELGAFSPNGRMLAFSSEAKNLVAGDTNGVADVFVFDRTTGAIALISKSLYGQRTGNQHSTMPVFVSGGKKLAFTSWATDIVPHDFNNQGDIFLADLASLYAVGPTLAVRSTAQGLAITWQTEPGFNYMVQSTSDLSTSASWVQEQGPISTFGGVATWSPQAAGSQQRFYRVIKQ